MIQIIEKTFGRRILVDMVDMSKNECPLGFETDNTVFVRMPYGKFGVRIKATDPVDVVIRLDNVILVQRERLEAGEIHTISRGDDGKPFVFVEPGTTPKHIADDAGQPIGAERPLEQESLFPEAEARAEDDRYADSYGLVVVEVRFSHVKPDYGPMLPPDGFSNVLFQMNEPTAHLRAVTAQFTRMVRPEPLAEGTPEFNLPDAEPVQKPIQRTCCIAYDREHSH
jgi:hypothetical protein